MRLRVPYKFLKVTRWCIGLLLYGSTSLMAQTDIMSYTLPNGKVKTVKNAKDWSKKRAQILEGMQQVMGPFQDTRNLSAPNAIFLDSVEFSGFIRYRVHLQSYPGEVVPILLYIPKNTAPDKRHAAMLALHGTGAKGKFLTDSSEAGPNRATATELAHRGYVVIAPDYPSFGELSNHDFAQDRFESGTMQAIFNHVRCIDYLVSRKDVDADRIGVIGHSLGGHNAMFLGAFDERVKIVVASCGWTLFENYNAGKTVTERYGGKLGPWAQDRYMPLVRDKYQLDAAKMPFNFDEVIGAIAPRYFFSNSPLNDGNFDVQGVKNGVEKASQVYKLLHVNNRLEVHHPDAGHDFPIAVRQIAYKRIDEVLKK